jgi:hypothetical protein
MARRTRKPKHFTKAADPNRNPDRRRVKRAIELTHGALMNSLEKGGYDGYSSMSWYDSATCNFGEAMTALTRLGWTNRQIQRVWENLLYKTGA